MNLLQIQYNLTQTFISLIIACCKRNDQFLFYSTLNKSCFSYFFRTDYNFFSQFQQKCIAYTIPYTYVLSGSRWDVFVRFYLYIGGIVDTQSFNFPFIIRLSIKYNKLEIKNTKMSIIVERKTQAVRIQFFVYIKSCQYSMFYINKMFWTKSQV